MAYAESDKKIKPLKVGVDDDGELYFVLPDGRLSDFLALTDFTPLLNDEQVAVMLGVTTHAIRKWRREGKLGHVKLSGAVRFEYAEVLAFIERNRRPAAVA